MLNKGRNCYNKYQNIGNKSQQNPRRHVYCLNCRIVLMPFTFNNGEILHVSTREQL